MKSDSEPSASASITASHALSSPSRATESSGKAPRPSDAKEDVALIYGVSDDGRGLEIVRKRDGRVEAGTVRPLEQGKPLHGEVVRLKPRPHAPFVCDVEVDFAPPQRAQARSGPPQVATDQYRRNWDAIYNKDRATKSDGLVN